LVVDPIEAERQSRFFSTLKGGGGAMKDNLYKIVVLEESELLFGGSVKVSFPTIRPWAS
jgi:hypothetical protein